MSNEYIPENTLFDVGLSHFDEPEIEPEDDNPWVQFVKKYKTDPVAFCRDVLGAEPFGWQQQAMTMLSGPDPVRRLSVRSGHGVGKTACVSMLCVHKLVTTYPVKIVVTAPSYATLQSGLLPEIKSWVKRLPDWLQDLFDVTTNKIVLKSDPDAAFLEARTSSADRPEALAGIHSKNVLIVCDEASGIPENVFEAAAGGMSTKGSQTILIGNPTRLTGLFYKSHNELRQHPGNPEGVWPTLHVSCLNVPEVVDSEFVNDMRLSHGEESNEFRIRVLGEFAATDNTSLIAAELVESAMERDVELDPMAPLVYGVDPARMGGDRAVLCKRRGNVVLEFITWRDLNLMQLVGHIVHEARQDKPDEIVVDAIGVGGGVADRLRELGFNVRDCQVSESSALNPQAALMRDELWLSLRDWLGTRVGSLPKNQVLREELVATSYTFSSAGKYKIEAKESMRKRLRRSPDMADALCLTFAGIMAGIGGRSTKWVPGEPLKRNVYARLGGRRL